MVLIRLVGTFDSVCHFCKIRKTIIKVSISNFHLLSIQFNQLNIVIVAIHIDHMDEFTDFRLIAAPIHLLTSINDEFYQFHEIAFNRQQFLVFGMRVSAVIVATPILRL